MRIIIFLLCLLMSPLAFGVEVTRTTLANSFKIYYQNGDQATLYFSEDGSLSHIPSFSNKEYSHNCNALWKFDEKKKIVAIYDVGVCKFLKGKFYVSRDGKRLKLVDGPRSFIFYPLNDY